jgi:hypothetical protein
MHGTALNIKCGIPYQQLSGELRVPAHHVMSAKSMPGEPGPAYHTTHRYQVTPPSFSLLLRLHYCCHSLLLLLPPLLLLYSLAPLLLLPLLPLLLMLMLWTLLLYCLLLPLLWHYYYC